MTKLSNSVFILKFIVLFSAINLVDVHPRSKKLLNIFTLVRFQNGNCITTNNSTGTCLTSVECSGNGGTALGICAASFGVCCLFEVSSCGSTVSRNCSYITNQGYPFGTSTGQTCKFTIARASSDVCSVRLDFDNLVLADPSLQTAAGNDGGQCLIDSLSFNVTGGRTYPTLCGVNSGYHAIFDLPQTGDVLNLNFNLGSSVLLRTWKMKVTQLICGLAPPACCFQYYTGLTGQIFSFNWQNTNTPLHLSNQNYQICIRQEKGNCCIKYFPISIYNGSPVNGWQVDPSRTCTADCNTAAICRNDYLIIPNASENGSRGSMTYTRFCGPELNIFATIVNEPVVSCSNPFRLYFHTIPNGNQGSGRGFALNYRQIPCGAN